MVRRQQASDRAARPAMRSPGRPYPPRHVEQEFWRRIAAGMGSEDAAGAVGVSGPVRVAVVPPRWRHATYEPCRAVGPVSVVC